VRLLTRVTLVTVGALAVIAFAVLASAASDQPSRSYRDAVVVSAKRSAIWSLLTDVERYEEWNPYVVRGRGSVSEGADISLTLRPKGGTPTTRSAAVLVFHPRRKFEWRTRRLVPGILDYEQVFRVLPLGNGRWRLVQEARIEGLGALIEDFDDDRAALVEMLHAIARLAPGYQSSSP
jgi:hypothetical protein